MNLDPGDTLDEFTVIKALEPGKSATGKVYTAKTDAVIKLFTMKDNSRGYELRYAKFKAEAKILNKLKHSNHVVRTLTEFRLEGVHNTIKKAAPYYATELMDGNVEDYILANDINLNTKIGIIIQLLQAVKDIHQAEIGHRDIYTPNILYKVKNKELECKLCDFGSAREHGRPQVFPYHDPMGNLHYTSPEASVGLLGGDNPEMELIFASDIFAVGLTMFEILTTRKQENLTQGLAAVYHRAAQKGLMDPTQSKEAREAYLQTEAIPILEESVIEEITSSDILASESIVIQLNELFKQMIVFDHTKRSCKLDEHIAVLERMRHELEVKGE